jgi:hypothetical protein
MSGDFLAGFASVQADWPHRGGGRFRGKRARGRENHASQRKEEASRHEETSPGPHERRMNDGARRRATDASLAVWKALCPNPLLSHFLRLEE